MTVNRWLIILQRNFRFTSYWACNLEAPANGNALSVPELLTNCRQKDGELT